MHQKITTTVNSLPNYGQLNVNVQDMAGISWVNFMAMSSHRGRNFLDFIHMAAGSLSENIMRGAKPDTRNL